MTGNEFNRRILKEMRYFYRIERITHRPAAEDKITVIKEVKEDDLHLSRILATKFYLDEIQYLHGKYSPASFNTYDTRKGIGFNYQLLLVDSEDEEVYVVESTMEKIEESVVAQREEEKEIFVNLGLDYTSLTF